MSESLLIRFARKPESLAEVRAASTSTAYRFERAHVAETIALTEAEYDDFTKNLLKDCSWLDGKGGERNGLIQAVAVTAPERETLYINPEGYSYARYVGVAISESIN